MIMKARLAFAASLVVSTAIALSLVGAGAANGTSTSPEGPAFQDGPALITPTVPPPGFNPLTATNAQLIANGLPPHPAGVHPGWWIRAVTNNHWVPLHFTTLHGRTHIPHMAPAAPQGGSGTAASGGLNTSNWSGNEDYTSSGPYQSIVAQWVVPSVTSLSGQNAYSSVWPGLGLGNSDSAQLFQAGSEQDSTWLYVLHVGEKQYFNYALWWEITAYDGGMYPRQQGVGFGASPGQTVFVNVSYDTSTGQAHFYIKNDSTGQVDSFNVNAPGTFGGKHAEWIYERTEENGNYPQLAKLTSALTLTDANAEINGTWQGVGNWPHYWINMYDYHLDDSTEYINASPTSINSAGNSFGFTWNHYGDVDAPNT